MAVNTTYDELSSEEIQARIQQRTAELMKLKEQAGQQDKAAPVPAKAATPAAEEPAKKGWSIPKPSKAPSWTIFMMPLMFIYNAREQMSTEAICACIIGVAITGCAPPPHTRTRRGSHACAIFFPMPPAHRFPLTAPPALASPSQLLWPDHGRPV